MAIIIDTNCFSRVFNGSNAEHAEFQPVIDWILYGHGFIVYGGSKYMSELKKAKKYLRFFNILKSLGKAIEFKEVSKRIDKITFELEEKYGDKDFDDPHLPAIAQVTKCRIICSDDTRSIGYVRNSKMYPKRYPIPMYYTGYKDKDILNDRNIDDRLLHYRVLLNKSKKQHLERIIEHFDDGFIRE